jgi:hypothetical protein
VFGVALLVLSLAGAGWIQGHDLLDPKISFADIANHTRSWLLVAVAAHGLLLLGNLVFFVSILRSVFACLLSSSTASAETPFRDAGALEAPVS